MDAAELLDRDAFSITEWDESMIRQMVDTVKVMSKNKIIVTLKGGAENQSKIGVSNMVFATGDTHGNFLRLPA